MMGFFLVVWRAHLSRFGQWLPALLASIIALLLSRLLLSLVFSAPAGQARVIPAGSGALPTTLAAGLLCGIAVAACLLLPPSILSQVPWSVPQALLPAAIAFLACLVVAVLAALA
jgi:hypothetical protein